MMRVRVKLFAMIRELAGMGEGSLSLAPGASAGEAVDALIEDHPKLKEWKPYIRVAVNCTYVPMGFILHDGDEVAVIPPVSGG